MGGGCTSTLFWWSGIFGGRFWGNAFVRGKVIFLRRVILSSFLTMWGGSPLLGGNRAFMAEPSDRPAINNGLGGRKKWGWCGKKGGGRNEEKKTMSKRNLTYRSGNQSSREKPTWYGLMNEESETKIFFFSLKMIKEGCRAEVFVDRPTLRASMAQGLFLGGSRRRAVVHMRPEFPKMPTAPSAFPLLGGASGAGRWTQPPRREWKPGGKDPWGRRKIIHSPSHTRPDPCLRQHGRPKWWIGAWKGL